VPPSIADALQTFRDAYDMREHSKNDSPQAAALTPELTYYFAVVGALDACIERLGELAGLGLDKLLIAGNFSVAATAEGREAQTLFEDVALPALRDP